MKSDDRHNSDLPFIDELSTVVDAEPTAVWEAIAGPRPMAAPRGAGAEAMAALLGCRHVRSSGSGALDTGDTVPGFLVAEARPPQRLVLAGQHRFSRYSLTLRVEPDGARRSRLLAETHAAFPGAAGRAYRALVIGTGGHRIAVRRLLRAAASRAEAIACGLSPAGGRTSPRLPRP